MSSQWTQKADWIIRQDVIKKKVLIEISNAMRLDRRSSQSPEARTGCGDADSTEDECRSTWRWGVY